MCIVLKHLRKRRLGSKNLGKSLSTYLGMRKLALCTQNTPIHIIVCISVTIRFTKSRFPMKSSENCSGLPCIHNMKLLSKNMLKFYVHISPIFSLIFHYVRPYTKHSWSLSQSTKHIQLNPLGFLDLTICQTIPHYCLTNMLCIWPGKCLMTDCYNCLK